MQNSSQPKLLPVPFADSGSKQDIPNDSQIGVTAGRASYTDGFPPLTRTPLAAGGVPPFGTDFNGVLNDVTAAVRWSQAGAGYPFNTAFNTAIGGYPKGARIPNSTLDGFWLNTTDGNSTNPENTTSALTGWVPSGVYGVTSITGLSGSSVTLTTLQAAKDRIILAGTLTANINILVPAWIKRWEIVNNCSGNFTITIKTPSGSGVALSNGQSNLVQGDGTNVISGANQGSLLRIQSFPTSGTYIPSAGATKIRVRAWGAGGAGGGTATANVGAGSGAAGAYVEVTITLPQPLSQYSVIIGTGGASVAANSSAAGASGGASSISALGLTAGGGGGSANATGGVASSTTIASLVVAGQNGQGGNTSNGVGGQGGASFGSYGGLARTSSAGSTGGFPGGGGAGASYVTGSPQASGAGSNGLIIIEEYS